MKTRKVAAGSGPPEEERARGSDPPRVALRLCGGEQVSRLRRTDPLRRMRISSHSKPPVRRQSGHPRHDRLMAGVASRRPCDRRGQDIGSRCVKPKYPPRIPPAQGATAGRFFGQACGRRLRPATPVEVLCLLFRRYGTGDRDVGAPRPVAPPVESSTEEQAQLASV